MQKILIVEDDEKLSKELENFYRKMDMRLVELLVLKI